MFVDRAGRLRRGGKLDDLLRVKLRRGRRYARLFLSHLKVRPTMPRTS